MIKKMTIIITLLFLILTGCTSQVRIQTDPYDMVLTTPIFGSIGNSEVYAEFGFDISEAKGVEILSILIQGDFFNSSSLSIDIKTYMSLTGDSSTINKVRITDYPPSIIIEDDYHRILDFSLNSYNSNHFMVTGETKPILNRIADDGYIWIVVHASISGIDLSNPEIRLNDLVIDMVIEKEMDNFIPLLDLF